MSLINNLQKLLTETQSYFETPLEEKGKIILTLKPEVPSDPESFANFIRFFNPLKKRLGLERYIEQQFITKPKQVPGYAYPLNFCEKVQYQIDTVSLHVDILRGFFGCPVTKEQVSQSMGILIKNGWSSDQFLSEFGLSRSTYFRYAPKKEESKETQPNATASPETLQLQVSSSSPSIASGETPQAA
jgi:hypothetical protein